MHHIGISYKLLISNDIEWITGCDKAVYDTGGLNLKAAEDGSHPIGIVKCFSFEDPWSVRKDFLIPEWSPDVKPLRVDCPKCDAYLQMKLLSETGL